ncbi:MAG: tyrosine-type recombinase/integrase [Planctomycetota bacterium]|jgi:integrase
MPKRKRQPPSYRQRKGYDQAIVTLTDSVTRYRKDYWLGPYGSPESRELYHRVLAHWESGGRRLPVTLDDKPADIAQVSVAEVLNAYWKWATRQYGSSELGCLRVVIRLLRQMFGSTPAADFGPNRLRLVRDQMILGDENADPPRKPWARPTINHNVHRLVAVFKWAASHEMVPASVYERLKTVPALRRGATGARETNPVQPVSLDQVEAVRPYLNRHINALVSLQLHTGARGGELFRLRPIDIQIHSDSGIWTIEPADHKTACHGHHRTIYLGPRAQAAIEPFLAGRAVDAYLFSPAEAEAERRAAARAARKTPLRYGNRPGTNRRDAPARALGDHYTSNSYRLAVQRACDRAFPPPEHLRPRVLPNGRRETKKAFLSRLTEAERAELRKWREEHRWRPHQLRHTAGTLIRREFGLEAAQLALGHSSAKVTDAVYAERDTARVIEVMKRIG